MGVLYVELVVITCVAPWLAARWVRAGGARGRAEALVRRPWEPALRRAGGLVGAAAVALAAGGAAAWADGAQVAAVAATRVALLAWAVLCVALGGATGRPGVAVLAAAFVAGGVVFAAPLYMALPGRPEPVTVVLAASPLVAVADAAGVDLLHTDPFYWLSPAANLPGRRVGWIATAAGHMLAALALAPLALRSKEGS